MKRDRCGLGFTLIELLVVLGIVAVITGMMFYNFSNKETKRQSVKAAAEELAATFRKARTWAMERKSVHAVVFNIQNEPGSSGAVLNNRSGGHWYRILGTTPMSMVDRVQQLDDIPPVAVSGYKYMPHTVYEFQQNLDRAWVEEAHVLPAKKVRFLALTDMDWGDALDPLKIYGVYSQRGTASTSYYPRPWFGWWDSGTKTLYPWGGYKKTIAGSGFYYWGVNQTNSGTVVGTADPEPTGCINQAARVLDHWSTGQANSIVMPTPDSPNSERLYEAGSPRPLINAGWRDASIVFLSTGEVRWGYWMPSRHCQNMWDGKTPAGAAFKRGVFDRCNGTYENYGGRINQHLQAEAGNFDVDSGGWFVTLAPDSQDDNDVFQTAQSALDSISPAYRVFISRIGEVKIIAVANLDKTNGLTAFPPNAAWWQTNANVAKFFPNDRCLDGTVLNGSGGGIGKVQGVPITDFITPAMLAQRQIWMK